MKLIAVLLVVCLTVLAIESQSQGGRRNGRGRRKYKHRPPSKDVGKKLKSWKRGVNKEFPHEMGADHYEEFDIIYPPNHARNFELPEAEKGRWTGGIVPYVIIGGYLPEEVSLIQTTMQQFNRNTCVQFVPRTNEAIYLKINDSETGCWSHVGMWSNNNYNVANLQDPNCMNPGTIAHELMHAIGFHHEFTRPDRDAWIDIDVSALALKRQTPAWIDANFGILSTDQVDLFGIEYYYGSVMHYSKYAGAWNYSRQVVKNKKPWEGDFGSKTGLTPIDILAINKAYNCKAAAAA